MLQCAVTINGLQVIPEFAEELGARVLPHTTTATANSINSSDSNSNSSSVSGDYASSASFDLTAELHRRGIGVRHVGLLRGMFWRQLQGTVAVAFNSARVRTKRDMRDCLRPGDTVRIDGVVYR
jgi:hypothetical protein